MRQGIGRGQRIIARLMHVFLTPGESSSSINACVSHSREALRKVAGQALAMLAIGNVGNCLAMLRQTGYSFIEELATMVHVERYRCVAASLLRSVCMHARPELKDTDLKQLSYISRMVSTTNPSYYVSCVQCANYAKAETCFHFLKKLIQPATHFVPNYSSL